jgi:type IV pilus biogenesis protein CpaD/CtpE
MMMRRLSAILLAAAALSLSACEDIPSAAFRNRAGPEALLDRSSELVNLDLAAPGVLDQLTQWLGDDQPSHAELYCDPAEDVCARAQGILDQFGVPVMVQQGDYSGRISLVYERVLARDCDNRYIDNPINPYNLPHPTFGCSVAVNQLQMISDKNQIVAPSLSGYPSGHKSAQALQKYEKKSEEQAETFGTLIAP